MPMARAPSSAHASAIGEGRTKPFHKQEAFIRFRPYASTGSLGGSNALAEPLVVFAPKGEREPGAECAEGEKASARHRHAGCEEKVGVG